MDNKTPNAGGPAPEIEVTLELTPNQEGLLAMALAKAKAEFNTTDNIVALVAMCAKYRAGKFKIKKPDADGLVR